MSDLDRKLALQFFRDRMVPGTTSEDTAAKGQPNVSGETELQNKSNEGAEELNYFGAVTSAIPNQAYNWATELYMDSQARIDMLDEVAQTDIPGVEAMTLDERMLAEQDVLWKSLNPAQKLLIGLGRGTEKLLGAVSPVLGTVDDQKELLMV